VWGSLGDSEFAAERVCVVGVAVTVSDAAVAKDVRKLRGIVEISRSLLRPRGLCDGGRAVVAGSVIVEESHVVGSGAEEGDVVFFVCGRVVDGSCCFAMSSHASRDLWSTGQLCAETSGMGGGGGAVECAGCVE